MNERIKELAQQAGLVPGGYANGTKIMTWREHFDNPGSLEKFAELIVKECISFQDEAGVYSKFDMAEAISRHFGVK